MKYYGRQRGRGGVGLCRLRWEYDRLKQRHEERLRTIRELEERNRNLQKCLEECQAVRAGTVEEFQREIEQRKEAQAQIRQNEEEYRALFENSRDGIVITTRAGNFVDVNQAFADLVLCESKEDALGRNIQHFYAYPEERATMREKLDRIGSATNFELKLRRMDGSVIDTLHTISVRRDRDGQVVGYQGIMRDITDQKKAEQAKELLLREIHHRVKNNLQVVSSLMRIQARHATDESSRILFKEAEKRVLTMALVHRRLYDSYNLAEIDFGSFVEELLRFLTSSYSTQRAISVRTTIPTTNFPMDTAIPLGFIITELVTNCFRHAFPEQEDGEVQVTLEHLPRDKFRLTVADNGIGISKWIDPLSPNSLGLKLIGIFVAQLGGSLSFGRENGAEFRILFRVYTKSAGRPHDEGS